MPFLIPASHSSFKISRLTKNVPRHGNSDWIWKLGTELKAIARVPATTPD